MSLSKNLRLIVVISIALFAAGSAYALYGVTKGGSWSKNWPKELDPLREQSRSLYHTRTAIHVIPFTNREEFEAAWPHILSVKSKESPLTLSNRQGWPFDKESKCGVSIYTPRTGKLVTPDGTNYPANSEEHIPDGKFLRIGPPWPDSIKSESGELPKFVVQENGKWAPYSKEKHGETRSVIRARTEIALFVDGEIVDLNRVPLPADTPIVDKRFLDGHKD